MFDKLVKMMWMVERRSTDDQPAPRHGRVVFVCSVVNDDEARGKTEDVKYSQSLMMTVLQLH